MIALSKPLVKDKNQMEFTTLSETFLWQAYSADPEEHAKFVRCSNFTTSKNGLVQRSKKHEIFPVEANQTL